MQKAVTDQWIGFSPLLGTTSLIYPEREQQAPALLIVYQGLYQCNIIDSTFSSSKLDFTEHASVFVCLFASE